MIDKTKLAELLADENATTESIYSGLGYNNEAAFYYHLKKDSEAKKLFADWRATHKRTSARRGGGSSRVAKGAKRAKRATPPPQRECQTAHQRRTFTQAEARI